MDEEKYSEMQNLEYQIRQLQQIMESIDSQLLEINNTKSFLEDFSKLKGNEEMLFPIVNGIFASGTVTQNKTVKVNVGNNVVVEKSIDEVKIMLDNQGKEIENYRKEVASQMQSFVDRLSELESESRSPRSNDDNRDNE